MLFRIYSCLSTAGFYKGMRQSIVEVAGALFELAKNLGVGLRFEASTADNIEFASGLLVISSARFICPSDKCIIRPNSSNTSSHEFPATSKRVRFF